MQKIHKCATVHKQTQKREGRGSRHL